jgi:hypothetical protein
MGGNEWSSQVSKFLTKLSMENADDKDDGKWVLTADLLYQSNVANRVITVPKGFETDLASVPRMPVVFLLTGDTSDEAAVVHDFLYSTHMVDRATADAVLREASAVTGVPVWRRWLMWAGVRCFGGSHWETEPLPT